MYSLLVLILNIILFVSNNVDGFSLGAPESACGIKAPEYLNPLMCSNSPNTETTYKWEFSKTTIDINESIDINISKKTQDAENFLGLLIYAKINDEFVGSFDGFSNLLYKNGPCNDKSSATHGSRDSKDSAFFTWTAPSSLPSDVILTLILVTRRSSFDDVCNYQALTQTIVASTPAPTTIASITSTSTSIQTTTIDVVVDNCAKYVDLGHRAQCDECFEQLPNDPTLQELENLEDCLAPLDDVETIPPTPSPTILTTTTSTSSETKQSIDNSAASSTCFYFFSILNAIAFSFL